MQRTHLLHFVLGSVMTVSLSWAAEPPPEITHDGLERVESSKADLVYVLPDADFAVYDRFVILEPLVAFRKNWQRDFNRGQRSLSEQVQESDMERIKSEMADLFVEVFTEELERNGFPVVDQPAEDVMILRPAIINLDVAAPDLQSASRNQSFVASAGSATLYVEFFDSVTAQILARAVDSRQARNTGNFQWATSVSNRAEARDVLRRWARILVDKLDEIRKGEGEPAGR